MLSLLFAICMIWFIGKFFPVILMGMVVGGLMYIEFPLLIIGGVIAVYVKKRGSEP